MRSRAGRWPSMMIAGLAIALFSSTEVGAAPPPNPTPSSATVQTNGTPYAQFTVPGRIPAVDFNHGGSPAAYYWNPNSGGNDQSLRPNTSVMISQTGGQTYITSSVATTGAFAGYAKDYVKYTFQARDAGWYHVDYNADSIHGGTLTTVMDGVQEGQSPSVPVSSAFTTVSLPEDIFLNKGAHTLMVVFNSGQINLASISVSRTRPPVVATPTLIRPQFPGESPFVANAVVTAPPFRADPTGQHNSAPAIQSAIDAVSETGGGVVYIPAGRYKIDGSLSVPENVVLRGQWQPPQAHAKAVLGTLLEVGSDSARQIGTPLITLSGPNATVRDLATWYEYQTPSHAIKYAPTIASVTYSTNVMDVTLYNSYEGIDFTAGSESTLTNIYGTCLYRGIILGGDEESSYVQGVHFHDAIWANAPAPISSSVTESPSNALPILTTSGLTGLVLRRNDGLTVNDVSVTHALHGIVLEQGRTTGFYGSLSDIHASINPEGYNRGVGYVNTTSIPQLDGHAYTSPPTMAPKGTVLAVVHPLAEPPVDPGHEAGSPGDATASIQKALDQVAHRGGGAVYLVPGVYRIYGHLVVPSGVELVGGYGAPHGAETKDTTILWAYGGSNTDHPNRAAALISLDAHSGVQGLSILYPNQQPNAIIPYPYTFRTLGPGCWIQNIDAINPYNLMDLASSPSNGFVVSGIVAAALNHGIVVGGGTQTGWLQRVLIDYGTWFQSDHLNSPFLWAISDLQSYTLTHTVSFTFDQCTSIEGFGLSTFNIHTGFVLGSSTRAVGPQDLWLYGPASDTSNGPGYRVSAGQSIYLVGLLGGSTEPQTPLPPPFLETTPSFTGTVTMYGAVNWATTKTPAQQGGTVELYEPPAPPTSVSYVVGQQASDGLVPVLPGGSLVDSRYTVASVYGRTADVMTTNPTAGSPPYSMLYFRVARSSGLLTSAPTTLYLTVTYANAPKGLSLTAEYNSSIVSAATVNGRYTPLPTDEPAAVTTGAGGWTTVTWKLPDTAFAESEKTAWAAAYGGPAGADFRIEAVPGVAISGVTVSLTPPATSVSYIAGQQASDGLVPVLPGGSLVDSRYTVASVYGRTADVMTTNPYAGSPPYSMLYFRVTRSSGLLIGSPTTLYLTVTYANAPKGLSLTAEYNSSIVSAATVNGRYTPLPADEPAAVTTGAGGWTTVTWKLPDTAFAESEKTAWAAAYGEPAGADFRIEALPGVAISEVTISLVQ